MASSFGFQCHEDIGVAYANVGAIKKIELWFPIPTEQEVNLQALAEELKKIRDEDSIGSLQTAPMGEGG